MRAAHYADAGENFRAKQKKRDGAERKTDTGLRVRIWFCRRQGRGLERAEELGRVCKNAVCLRWWWCVITPWS